jgi:hypothetical protein
MPARQGRRTDRRQELDICVELTTRQRGRDVSKDLLLNLARSVGAPTAFIPQVHVHVAGTGPAILHHQSLQYIGQELSHTLHCNLAPATSGDAAKEHDRLHKATSSLFNRL